MLPSITEIGAHGLESRRPFLDTDIQVGCRVEYIRCNQDNTFVMPLTVLNNTYVFNPFPNHLNESKPLIVSR